MTGNADNRADRVVQPKKTKKKKKANKPRKRTIHGNAKANKNNAEPSQTPQGHPVSAEAHKQDLTSGLENTAPTPASPNPNHPTTETASIPEDVPEAISAVIPELGIRPQQTRNRKPHKKKPKRGQQQQQQQNPPNISNMGKDHKDKTVLPVNSTSHDLGRDEQQQQQQNPPNISNMGKDHKDKTVLPVDSTSHDLGRDESSQGVSRAKTDGASRQQEIDTKESLQDRSEDIAEDLSKDLRGVHFADDLKDTQGSKTADGGSSTVAAFKFDSMDRRLTCPKPDCRRMTSCWDSAVVICPACGPDSYVRYCSKEHLFEDIQRHWLMECGKAKVAGPIDRDTIRDSQTPPRAYIVGHFYNVVERHRQAVYRAMLEPSYFIFDDISMVDDAIAAPTKEEWNAVRGTGPVVFQVVFFDDFTPLSRKRMFEHHILQCLMFGDPGAHASCLSAMHLIREALIVSGEWTEEILTNLCMQLAGEWGGFSVPLSFYNVQEVNEAWNQRGLLPAFPTD